MQCRFSEISDIVLWVFGVADRRIYGVPSCYISCFLCKIEVNGGGEKIVLPVVGMFRCTTKHITLKAWAFIPNTQAH